MFIVFVHYSTDLSMMSVWTYSVDPKSVDIFHILPDFLWQPLLRANVGKYRESQISSKNSSFGWYNPNMPLGELFQETILRNPQALYILRILEKFENSQ